MELSPLIPDTHFSRSVIGLVVAITFAAATLASPQSVDPVAEGDDIILSKLIWLCRIAIWGWESCYS